MSTRIRLQEAFKFALSIVLTYWLGLWMDWDLVKYGPEAIVLISLSTSGASINKAMMRVIGTSVACVVAIILIQWFSQARWSMMFALAGYLVFTSYFLQTSRYPYAWYVAAFVPISIWTNTYGTFDNTFHFAIFRLLETVSGVFIYSLVSVLLWPQTAGEQFYRKGGEYLEQLCHLVKLNQNELRGGLKSGEATIALRKLDVLSAQLQVTLGAALTDTMLVREYKHDWECALATLRTLTDSMGLWQSTNEMYQRLYPKQRQPELEQAMQVIEARCTRIGELWRSRQLPSEVLPSDDVLLLQKLALELPPLGAITNVERGLLINRIEQLRQLDQQSYNLLLLMRVLTGLDSSAVLPAAIKHLALEQPPRWDSVRLLKSLVPAIAFIIGFLFWVFPSTPPPTGQTIAKISAIFGLMTVLGANVRYVWLIYATAGLLVVAPIYFIVMPWLDSGAALLTMIFLLSFTFGYLGQRWPMLKTSVMLLFVMSTAISNNQSYSFVAWISGEFLMVIAGIIINVVMMFMVSIRPERLMSRYIHDFFYTCSEIPSGFINITTRKQRQEGLLRKLRGTLAKLRKVERTLDYSRLPENERERVNHLLDSIESIAARLRVVNTLAERFTANGSVAPLGSELPRRLQQLFERWAKITTVTRIAEEERDAVKAIYYELEERLDAYNKFPENPSYNERVASDMTALIGGVRGLLDAMDGMEKSIRNIHWTEWTKARI